MAFLVDLWLGDPEYRFHPVRLIGKGIERGELFLRRYVPQEKLAGMVLAVFFPLAIFGLVWILLFFAGKVHSILAMVVNILGIYTAISVHDLKKESKRIWRDLERKDLSQARGSLARIVGRDTRHLDEKEIVRATVETVAESTVDGIAAPLFYAALGGAPLALAYKAVNTLDSMIGHRNDRYRHFGYAAAKQDTLLNWIPARLAYGSIALASFFIGGKVQKAFSIGWKDGILSGENSFIPEATFAGTLRVQLGGWNSYEGRVVEKPFLGTSERPLDRRVILESIRLMTVAAWVTLWVCVILSYSFRFKYF